METEKMDSQLQTETGVSSIPKTRIIEREALPNSPFTLVTVEEGSFIAMGHYRLTDYKSKEDAYNEYETRNWDLILAAVSVLQEVSEKSSGFKQLS